MLTFCLIILFWIIISNDNARTELSAKNYNNGYCTCGTKWRFINVARGKGDSEYAYECPNCHRVITLNKLPQDLPKYEPPKQKEKKEPTVIGSLALFAMTAFILYILC